MMFGKVEVIPLREFLKNEPKQEYGVAAPSIVIPLVVVIAASILFYANPVFAATTEGVISRKFDDKIWPLMLDIGRPLAKTMMAIGIYRCIRNDVDKGWKTFYRAGLGLIGLFLIDGVIHIIDGVGIDLSKS